MKSCGHLLHGLGLVAILLALAALGCGLPPVSTPTPAPPTQVSSPAIEARDAPPAGTPLPTLEADAEEALLINLYRRVNPAVVHIRVYGTGLPEPASGSGFLIDDERHIVTNSHVVRDADDDDIEVVFWDATRVRGRVVGMDLDADLAVLEADSVPQGVTPLEWGDSDAVQVGQRVIAIGNPFGFQGSMTVGIISAVGRRLESQRGLAIGGSYSNPDIIQTDAAINPGNSGGPLLDSAGRVVGINTAIRSITGGNTGVGFAAPANTARKLLPYLIRDGEYTYPWLGVSGLQEIDLRTMEVLELAGTKGVYVTGVTDGGPADQAGVRAAEPSTLSGFEPGRGGDTIVAIDNHELTDFSDLVSYLVAHTEPGQTVELSIVRDGETTSLPLTLGERP